MIIDSITPSKQNSGEKSNFFSLLNNSSDIFLLVSNQGKVLDVNNKFYKVTKTSKNDVIGKSLLDFFFPREDSNYYPFQNNLSLAILKGSSYEERGVLKLNDIPLFNVSICIKPISHTQLIPSDSLILIKPEYEQNIENYQLEKAISKTILHNNDNAIWILDKNYQLINFNNTFIKKVERVYQNTPTLYQNFLDIPSEDKFKRRWETRFQRALEGSHINFMDVYKVNGNKFFYDIKIYPILEKDDILGLVIFAKDVTRRQITEESLRISKERFELAIAGSQDGVWDWDIDKNHVYYSPIWKKMLGYETKEIPPKFEVLERLIHPEDFPYFKKSLEKYFNRKAKKYIQEFRIRHKDGGWRWIKANGMALRKSDGTVYRMTGSFRDITVRKLQQLKILEKEANLRAILDNNTDIIWLIDRNFELIDFNHNFSEFFNKLYDKYPSRGLNVLKTNPSEIVNTMWKERYDMVLKGYSQSFKIPYQVFNSERYFEIKLFPTKEKEEIVGVSVFMRDITRDISIEKVLREALLKSKEASEVKSQFLATMSHEIRTPMNAIIGMTHLLLQDTYSPEQKENLDTLLFSAESLLVLINDILDYNKLEANKIVIEQTHFSLQKLLHDIQKTFQVKAKEKGISLHVNKDDNIPKVLVGDPVRLMQIMNNLISNAIKFTKKGEVNVNLKLDKHKSGCPVRLIVEIKDTGIGIAQDKLDSIFEKFTQASEDTTRKFGGTGLGLAITKGLLELLDSKIEVESELGKGTTFRFVICLDEGDEQLLEENSRLDFATFSKFDNVTVLLVEDNRINQLIANKFLNIWGVNVDLAQNGIEAIEKLTTNDYNLVLMDIQMPEMDGYTASEMARKKGVQIPIIALTADFDESIKHKILNSGMNDLLAKPFNPKILYDKIAEYINKDNSSNINNQNTLTEDFEQEINWKNFQDIASNDLNYKKELKKLYIEFIRDLKNVYEVALLERDKHKLRAITHKAKSSLKFLNLHSIEKELYQGKLILESPNKKDIEESISKMKKYCDNFVTLMKKNCDCNS